MVLAGGIVATVATTPPPDPPCPSSPAEISGFYGAQVEDRGNKHWSTSGTASTGPFSWWYVRAEVRSCVAEDEEDGATPVDVELRLTDDGSGPELESFLRAALLVDGDGRARTVSDVRVGDDETVTMNNGLPVRAVLLRFDLPLDVPEPVVLRLPDLDGRDNGRLEALQIGPFGPDVPDEPSPAVTP